MESNMRSARRPVQQQLFPNSSMHARNHGHGYPYLGLPGSQMKTVQVSNGHGCMTMQ